MALTRYLAQGGALRLMSGGVITLAPPSAPQNLSVTAGDLSASLSWQAPISNGGSAITGYTITAVPTSGSTVTASAAAGATSGTVSGLVNGVSYTVSVKATNAIGAGSSSPGFTVIPTSTATIVKPDATNTGCRIARGSLTAITGAALAAATHTATPTRTWSGYLVTGAVGRIWCDNFTMVDCIVEVGSTNNVTGVDIGYVTGGSVTHCTIDGQGTSSSSPAIALTVGASSVATHNNLSGCQDQLHTSGSLPTSGQCTDNYVHGVRAPTSAHGDGFQLLSGSTASNINGWYFARNNIDVSDGIGVVNSAIQYGGFTTASTWTNYINEHNWYNGGGSYIASGGPQNVTLINVVHRNNRFGLTDGASGALYPSGSPSMAVVFTADATNVWDVTGTTTHGRSVTADTAVS